MRKEKTYSLSPERIKRMQLARKRRGLGYTRHLSVVRELAEKKIKELFDKWNLDLWEASFIVDPYDQKQEILLEMRIEDLELNDALKKVIEFLEMRVVSEVGILSYNEAILKETGQKGMCAFIEKRGHEYLVNNL